MGKSFRPDRTAAFRYSVVVPAHNSERTIEKAVRCALVQTLAPSEIIVIDDGSTDATSRAVNAISSPLIRLERQENAGPGEARNRGIEIARAGWVFFLDADDLWALDHAETLRKLSLEFPKANVLAASHFEVKGVPPAFPRESSGLSFLVNLFEQKVLWALHTSAVAMRRGFVQELGGFSKTYPGEDVDLWFRSALLSDIAMTSRVTCYYVRRDDSIMGQNGAIIQSLPKQPLLQSMDRAIADPRHQVSRNSLRLYRERVYRAFLLQAIAQADRGIAREIMRMMRARRIKVPFLISLLGTAPRPLLSLANGLRRRLYGKMVNHGR